MTAGMLLDALAFAAAGLAAVPAVLTATNLTRFRRSPPAGRAAGPVSVLVPARDEETSIERACRSILASRDVELELIVLDDDSRDATADIVRRLAAEDPRLRLLAGRPLPSGWCGKQHACSQLAEAASHELLVFLDADVTIRPDCLARGLAMLEGSDVSLQSGFPRQRTGSLVEWLLLPLIHYILLGFLPLGISRRNSSPSLAAGCGQMFFTSREAYLAAGGHAAIRASLHDGIKLPRAYRRAGLKTDIFDASDTAECRMYTRGGDVLRGLAKNATEGMAAPRAVIPATILLAGGQVLPSLLAIRGLATGWADFSPPATAAVAVAVLLSFAPRLVEAFRFRSSLASVVVHPVAVLVFLLIQWYGVLRRAAGMKASWKGRSLAPQ